MHRGNYLYFVLYFASPVVKWNCCHLANFCQTVNSAFLDGNYSIYGASFHPPLFLGWLNLPPSRMYHHGGGGGEGEGYFLDGLSLFMIALHMISRRYILLLILAGGKKFFLRPLLYRKEGKGQFRFWGKDEREYFLPFSSLSDEGKGVCRQEKAKKWGKEMWGLGLVGWGNSISLPTTRTRGRKNWINMMEMDPFFLGNEERRLPLSFPLLLIL